MLDIISRTYCKNVHVVQTCCRAISAMQDDRSFCSFREIINIVRGENSDKRQNIAKAKPKHKHRTTPTSKKMLPFKPLAAYSLTKQGSRSQAHPLQSKGQALGSLRTWTVVTPSTFQQMATFSSYLMWVLTPKNCP